jgi:hypothetical protein
MSNFEEVSKGILSCNTIGLTKINCNSLDMSCIAKVYRQDSSHSYVYQQIITSTVSTFLIEEDIVRKVKQMSILQLHKEYYGHILQKLNNLRSTVNKGNIYDIERELVDIIRSIHDEKCISEI